MEIFLSEHVKTIINEEDHKSRRPHTRSVKCITEDWYCGQVNFLSYRVILDFLFCLTLILNTINLVKNIFLVIFGSGHFDIWLLKWPKNYFLSKLRYVENMFDFLSQIWTFPVDKISRTAGKRTACPPTFDVVLKTRPF